MMDSALATRDNVKRKGLISKEDTVSERSLQKDFKPINNILFPVLQL